MLTPDKLNDGFKRLYDSVSPQMQPDEATAVAIALELTSTAVEALVRIALALEAKADKPAVHDPLDGL